ncbi:MAG TPA: hypothetical protein DCS93_02725 [Microscillaceae bacterium]|nr:hypothetical protein [Microscillaceae bacterium]
MTQKVPFTHQSVIITIFISLVTLGLYIPLWFITYRTALNSLQAQKQLPITGPVVTLVLLGTWHLFNFLSFFTDFTGDNESLNNIYDSIYFISFIAGIIWSIILSFQVQRMLSSYTQTQKYAVGYVGLFTFLFNIFYLQFKVNQLIRYEENQVWDIDSIGQHLKNN